MPLQNPSRLRRHIPAQHWGSDLGTDYWFNAAGGVTAADGVQLSKHGWNLVSLGETDASADADFLSSSDIGTPIQLLTNASGDLIESPAVFGDYIHGEGAAAFLGYSPTIMNVEFYAAMTVHSANENRSGWGLIEAAGSVATAADQMAFIYTDGTNFTIRSAAASDAGAADDATWTRFKMIVTAGSTIEWFIDGTSQGTLAVQADLWPCSFGMHALTTNRPALGWVHIWYE
jgi:hypothetical protein